MKLFSSAKQSLPSRPAASAAAAAVLLAFVLSSCGSGTPAAATTPLPTPTTSPTPTAAATPDPTTAHAAGCKDPVPPKITRINVHTQYKFKDYWVVDSSPLIGPNADYCAAIGFSDGRSFCTLRQEGADDRAACELWRAGMSKDTPPRPGPTWTLTTKVGVVHYGTGEDSGCAHDDDLGPWKVRAYIGGTYTVCVVDGACNTTDVDRNL